MRILVVDDSSPHRRMLTAIFGQAGHQVLTAPDGEAALALLERESVNAVVSDVRMPKLDGFQLCRAIRRDARWARLPFIFYSSVFIGGPARDLGRDVG
ncbi:MAG: hybrid sensor histidine kinase/response regulator, partial [Candidatus Rokuibacteriota bacterium]